MKIYLAQIFLSIKKNDMKKYNKKIGNIPQILESYYYINKKMKLINEMKDSFKENVK